MDATLHPGDAVTIANVAIWAALYADNVVLLSPTTPGLTRYFCSVEAFCAAERLRVGYRKTKQMLINQDRDISNPHQEDQKFEVVFTFKYLGVELLSGCSAR